MDQIHFIFLDVHMFGASTKMFLFFAIVMGLVRITSWYPDFNGSHFDLQPSEIHRMTGLPPKIV